MIKQFFRSVIFCLLMSSAAMGYAHDRYLSFTKGFTSATDFKVNKSITESDGYVDVTYTFDGAYLNYVTKGGTTYQSVGMPDAERLMGVGDPSLPYYSDVLALSSTDNVKVVVLKSNYKEYSIPCVIPFDTVAGSGNTSVVKTSTYSKNGFFPNTSVQLGGTGILSGVPMVGVKVYPVQYNPVKGKIRCYASITYRISYSSKNISSLLKKKGQAIEQVKPFVANPTSIDRMANGVAGLKKATASNSVNAPVYLILAPESKYTHALNNFVEWKSKQGYKCVVKRSDSWTTSTIESTLNEFYKQCTPDYLLLFGHQQDVPSKLVKVNWCLKNKYSFYTDRYYGSTGFFKDYETKEGNMDYYAPDVTVGRFPVSTDEEADIVVNKTIKYQSNPPQNEDFYKTGTYICYWDDPDNDGYENSPYFCASECAWMGGYYRRPNVKALYYVANGQTVEPNYFLQPTSDAEVYNTSYSVKDWAFTQILSGTWLKGADKTLIKNDIESDCGRSILNYSGPALLSWGNSRGGEVMNTETVLNLQNGDKLPFVFSIMPGFTGYFTYSMPCMAECFLKAENGGAIGVIGNSYYCKLYYGLVYNNKLFSYLNSPDGNYGNSVADVFSKMIYRIMLENPVDANSATADYIGYRYQSLVSHYFGDPSTQLSIGAPACFSPTITNSGTTVTVNTGVPGSKITLTSLFDPADEDKMVVVEGEDAKFTGIDYPYCITIQHKNYVTYTENCSDVYIQNYTFTKDMDINATHIYAGKEVLPSQTIGNVTINGNTINFTAKNLVSLQKGFSVTSNDKKFTAIINADENERVCFDIEDDETEGENGGKSLNIGNSDYKYVEADSVYANSDAPLFEFLPNPSTGLFSVNLMDYTSDITIYDSFGTKVKSYNNVRGNVTIDLTAFSAGIYVAKIDNDVYHLQYKLVKK